MRTRIDQRQPKLLRQGTVAVGMATLAMGLWSFFVPESFFRDFPVEGTEWVSTLGVFNDHLMRDFGAAQAGMGITAVAAGWAGRVEAAGPILWGFIAFGVLHLGYHFTTFGLFSTTSAASQGVALATFIAIPAGVLMATASARGKE